MSDLNWKRLSCDVFPREIYVAYSGRLRYSVEYVEGDHYEVAVEALILTPGEIVPDFPEILGHHTPPARGDREAARYNLGLGGAKAHAELHHALVRGGERFFKELAA